MSRRADQRKAEVLRVVRQTGPIRTGSLAALVGIGRRQVRRYLHTLEAEGAIESEYMPGGQHWSATSAE